MSAGLSVQGPGPCGDAHHLGNDSVTLTQPALKCMFEENLTMNKLLFCSVLLGLVVRGGGAPLFLKAQQDVTTAAKITNTDPLEVSKRITT